MKARFAITTIVITFFLIFEAHAGTAIEVFELASKSTVVVIAYNSNGEVDAFGSGVVLPDNSVATNCHVIENSAKIAVLYQQKEYQAKKRYTDPDRDTCTLTTTGLKAPSVEMGSTKGLKVGARVYAIGAPKGLELSLSEGIVSSLRPVEGGQYIQTTAPISPGSSGCGLFDENGRLLGLVSFYLAEGQNLNFALPVEWIVELPERQTSINKKIEATKIDWHHQVRAILQKKDWPKLKEYALDWINAEPEDAWGWCTLGYAYQKLRDQPDKAIRAFKRALDIEPKNVGFWRVLADFYIELNKLEKAIEAYEQALHIDPESAETWLSLGTMYEEIHEPANAIKAYEHALRIDPENAEGWASLGDVYAKLDQLSKAIDAYEQALHIEPEDANKLMFLGSMYKISGNNNKVMDIYHRLKKIDIERANLFFELEVLP
jgi:cytochrome c-type biogenesis protein CcmH/NrfG